MMHQRRVLTFTASLVLTVLVFPSERRALADEPEAAPATPPEEVAPQPAPTSAPEVEPQPAPTSAPEVPPPPPPRPEGRVLGGHVFSPALGIVEPFATTSFGSFITAGYGSSTGSLTLQLPGNPLPPPQTFSGKVDYAAVGGVLGFEFAFLRDLAARVILSETIYSGTTGAAAATVGTNARFGGDVGLTAGLPIGNAFRLSGVFDLSYAPRLGLLFGPAIQSTFEACSVSVQNCKFDTSKLLIQNNVLSVEPGAAFGWALSRPFGIQGNLIYSYQSIKTKNAGTATASALVAGAAADFDFFAISKVPVGLQFTWASRIPLANAEENRFTDLGGGLFYTGRKDLSLGFQLVNRRFRVAPDVDVSWSTFIALIGLRYYWN